VGKAAPTPLSPEVKNMASIILHPSDLRPCPKCGYPRCFMRGARLVEAYRYGQKWMATASNHKCSPKLAHSLTVVKKVLDFPAKA